MVEAVLRHHQPHPRLLLLHLLPYLPTLLLRLLLPDRFVAEDLRPVLIQILSLSFPPRWGI